MGLGVFAEWNWRASGSDGLARERAERVGSIVVLTEQLTGWKLAGFSC